METSVWSWKSSSRCHVTDNAL